MNDLVREWVEKAEGDFHSAERELRARKAPNYDAACFHPQQCAEKYLKAFLVHRRISFRQSTISRYYWD
jgi:HEPN domain-containing protein